MLMETQIAIEVNFKSCEFMFNNLMVINELVKKNERCCSFGYRPGCRTWRDGSYHYSGRYYHPCHKKDNQKVSQSGIFHLL